VNVVARRDSTAAHGKRANLAERAGVVEWKGTVSTLLEGGGERPPPDLAALAIAPGIHIQ